MKKKNLRYVVGGFFLTFCFGLNVSHILSGYGLATGPLSIFILAQSSSSGNGSSSSGGGSSSSGGGSSSIGGTDTSGGATKCLTFIASEIGFTNCGQKGEMVTKMKTTYSCKGEGTGECTTGSVVDFFNCDGAFLETNSFLSKSSCK